MQQEITEQVAALVENYRNHCILPPPSFLTGSANKLVFMNSWLKDGHMVLYPRCFGPSFLSELTSSFGRVGITVLFAFHR
jgi:hypothetical protein